MKSNLNLSHSTVIKSSEINIKRQKEREKKQKYRLRQKEASLKKMACERKRVRQNLWRERKKLQQQLKKERQKTNPQRCHQNVLPKRQPYTLKKKGDSKLATRLRQRRYVAKQLVLRAIRFRRNNALKKKLINQNLSPEARIRRLVRIHTNVQENRLRSQIKDKRLVQGHKLLMKLNNTGQSFDLTKLSDVQKFQLRWLGSKTVSVLNQTILLQQLNCIETFYRKLKHLQEASLKMIHLTQEQLKRQLNSNVIRHPDITDAEYVRTKLVRLKYHIKRDKEESDADYDTMQNLLPQLFHEQLTGLSVDNDVIDKEIDAVYETNIDSLTQDPMKPVCLAVTKNSPLIRKCSDGCPIIMNINQAADIMIKLQTMVHALSSSLMLSHFTQNVVDTDSNLLNFLREQSVCSTGCRTIVKRLVSLRSYVLVNHNVQTALRTVDVSKVLDLCRLKDIPKVLVNLFLAEFNEDEINDDHTEQKTYHNFGKLMDKTRSAFSELEIYSCDICDGLTLQREISNMDSNDIINEAKTHLTKTVYAVCLSCRRQLEKRKLPLRAVSNGMQIDFSPSVLQNLNWIEKAIIQRVRPVQHMVTLTDKAGRKTNVIATKGALVVLPVPTNGTMQHVANTLPSTANLNIIVRTNIGKRLVSLPKVLRALTWLKANNPIYRDIIIDSQFKFTFDSVHFEKEGATQTDLDNLIDDNGTNTILEHEDFNLQPIMQNNDTAPDGTTFEQYVLKHSPYKPFNVHDPNLDVSAFFHLHPHGINGTKDERRPVFASVREVIRQRLANKDRRFATDAAWLCFQHGLLQQQDMLGSMGISARMRKEYLTGAQVVNAIANEDVSFQRALATNTASLRCHQPYWDKCKKKLKAHIQLFKAPTFFVTLNPSFADWVEVHEAYSKLYNVPVDRTNVAEFVAKDPYIWTRHFQHRLRSVMNLLIKNKNGPFGEVLHYFYRIEYQARGTEHVHMLLWIKNAPTTSASEASIVAFIDKFITARMPNQTKEPLLHDLVSRLQQHNPKCTNTCKRFIKYRGRIYTRCRFEFPRKVCGFTRLNKKHEPLLGIRSSTTKYYSLKRRSSDTHTNDYNAALLLTWRGNVDVQFISPDSIDIINYITGYTTKNESSKKGSVLQQALYVDMTKTELFKTILSFLKQRETGVMEIVDWLMGHHMFEFDVSHINVNTNSEENRFRMLKKKSELKPDSSAFVNNVYDVYYPKRAKALNNVCLFSILVNFTIRKKTENDNPVNDGNYNFIWQNLEADKKKYFDDDDDFVTDESSDDSDYERKEDSFCSSGENNCFDFDYHTMIPASPFYCFPSLPRQSTFTTGTATMVFSKTRAHVPVIFWPHLEQDNADSRDDYFRRLCFMFIPWRQENLMIIPYNSFESCWFAFMDCLKNQSLEAYADIQKVINNVQVQIEADREVYRRRAELRKILKAEEIELDAEDEENTYDRNVDIDKHTQNVASLNTGQKDVFDHVMTSLCEQEHNTNVSPLRMFVSGTAGTGKTHLINTIADAITAKYVSPMNPKAAVLIAAPTGLAAIQINGSTLHKMFKLEVQRGNNKMAKKLSDALLNKCRVNFANVHLIIIDEISMCSNINLTAIHQRLDEIFNASEWFGGKNVLCFGDLLQLPPVLAPRVFEPLDYWHAKKYFNTCLPSLNLWSLFEYRELLENMRQKDDLEFALLMGRMRVEQMTSHDHETLQKQLIVSPSGNNCITTTELADFYLELQQKFPTTMALFPTRNEVTEFNMEVAKHSNLNIVKIDAEDSEPVQRPITSIIRRLDRTTKYNVIVTNKTCVSKTTKFAFENDGRKAGGLEKTLLLAVGSRIMLTRNIPYSNNLVNGSTGILLEIIYDDNINMNRKPIYLLIQFDRIENPVKIEPVSTTFDVGIDKQISRRQFPVVMAYAATIHKSQGLTLPQAILSTSKIFAPGQAFVGFSRVQNLKSLHLVDYNPQKIFADRESVIQYNLLRQKVKLPMFNVPLPRTLQQKSVTSNTDGAKIFSPNAIINDVLTNQKTNDDGILRLQNKNNDCFVIATVTALHACSLFVTQLLETSNFTNLLLLHLQQLFMTPQQIFNVTTLRQHLGAISRGVSMGDPEDVFADIFDALTPELRMLFTFVRCKYQQCACHNGTRQIISSDQPRESLMFNICSANNKGITFSELVKKTESRSFEMCKKCNKLQQKWIHRVAGINQKYLKIFIPRQHVNNNGALEAYDNVSIMQHKQSGMKIMGSNWKIIAAIEYHRDKLHYTSVCRTQKSWSVVDDNFVNKDQKLNVGLKKYSVLLFEKL